MTSASGGFSMCRIPPPAVGVAVLERSVDHVRDRLEAAMRVPGRALRLARRIFHLAHLVEMDERVEIGQVDPGERTTNREALPFEPARRARDASHRALAGDRRIGLRDAGQNGDVFDDDGGAVRLLVFSPTIPREWVG